MPSNLSQKERTAMGLLLPAGRSAHIMDLLKTIRPDLFNGIMCTVPNRRAQQLVGSVIARINRKLAEDNRKERIKPGSPRRTYSIQIVP